jgi:hypothetical protein
MMASEPPMNTNEEELTTENAESAERNVRAKDLSPRITRMDTNEEEKEESAAGKQPFRDFRVFRSSKLSPAWLLNYAKALAKTDGIEAAIPVVEEAYAADPKLKNGFSSVAWQRYIPEDMASVA